MSRAETPGDRGESSHSRSVPASEPPAPPLTEFETRWRALVAYGLLAAVFTLTLVMPLYAFSRGRSLATTALGVGGLFEGQLILAAFLAAWFALRRRSPVRIFLHLPRGRWGARIMRGLWVGVRGWLLTMAAMVVLGVLAHASGVTPNQGFVEIMLWMARRPLALRVGVIIVAMVVEEAFFRAFLQPRLGLILATCCFALSHVNYGSPTMGGGVFVIGWILGRTFDRTDDLAVCAVAHGTFDAIQLLIVLPLVASHM